MGKGPMQKSSKDDVWLSYEHMKRCSVTLREAPTRARRQCLTIWMAALWKTRQQVWTRTWGSRDLTQPLVQLLLKTVW